MVLYKPLPVYPPPMGRRHQRKTRHLAFSLVFAFPFFILAADPNLPRELLSAILWRREASSQAPSPSILYHTMLFYTVLYHTILYYTILYYTILFYSILYYTMT